MALINQVNAATKDLDAHCIDADQRWAEHKRDRDARDAFISECQDKFRADNTYCSISYRSGARFDRTAALINWYGSKGAYDMLHERGHEDALGRVRKNTEGKIAKRNHRIAVKLEKLGVTKLPEGEKLKASSDGFEGFFEIDGKVIEIRTIVAGGYNIQCIHNRVLIYVN